MATHEYVLTNPPEDSRAKELWLQHAAGFILFEDARQYAIDQIARTTSTKKRKAIIKGINDALYGMMMVIDGVSGRLQNDKYAVVLENKVKLLQLKKGVAKPVEEIDLADGDGMCMGFHGWLENDYGEDRPAGKRKVKR